ncbi:hypothetical protein FOA52_005451 [Chlamydomonas sp. UWO 241]|nr:hypothetical protein FOA52_005451 [Chlamydomonas sp. UWO 241]
MSNVYGGDEVNSIVIDVGSCLCKVGYGGDDIPKAIFPSNVGVGPGAGPEANGMEVDGKDGSTDKRMLHVGQQSVNFRRDGMEVATPFNEEGLLADWDAVEALWDHAFKDRLRINPAEYAMMMAEPSHNTRETREKMVEIMFEKFGCPALFLSRNAVLSAFATAKQTALVVDAGHEATTVAAVQDGYLLTKSVIRSPVGGEILSRATLAAGCAGSEWCLPRRTTRTRQRLNAAGDADEAGAQEAELEREAEGEVDDAVPRLHDRLAETETVDMVARAIVNLAPAGQPEELMHKSSAVRLMFSSTNPKSKDRLRRCANQSKYSSSVFTSSVDYAAAAVMMLGDPLAVIVSSGSVSAMALVRVTKLEVATQTARGGLFAVPNLTAEQLQFSSSRVSGALMLMVLEQEEEAGIKSRGGNVRPRYSFKRTERPGGEWSVEDLSLPNTTASFRNFQIDQIAADIKESVCRVSESAFDELANSNIPTVSYELPDGQEIHVGPDRFKIPEILFNPSLAASYDGLSVPSSAHALPGLTLESINRCDVDVRKELYSGVVLTGVNSTIILPCANLLSENLPKPQTLNPKPLTL